MKDNEQMSMMEVPRTEREAKLAELKEKLDRQIDFSYYSGRVISSHYTANDSRGEYIVNPDYPQGAGGMSDGNSRNPRRNKKNRQRISRKIVPIKNARPGVFDLRSYFDFVFFSRTFFGFGASAFAWRVLNRSTRPAVSMSFSSPVKNGWHLLQISTEISALVEPTVNLFPQAQWTFASGKYSGWMSFFAIMQGIIYNVCLLDKLPQPITMIRS